MAHLSARKRHPCACHALQYKVKRVETQRDTTNCAWTACCYRSISFIARLMRFLRTRSRDVSANAPNTSHPLCNERLLHTLPVDQKVVCNRFNGSRCARRASASRWINLQVFRACVSFFVARRSFLLSANCSMYIFPFKLPDQINLRYQREYPVIFILTTRLQNVCCIYVGNLL